jgi:hypothetical protein
MVTLDEVGAMTGALPEVEAGERHGNRTWAVRGKTFAWERSFSKADIRRYGDEEPPGDPIVAVRVEDLSEKEAVLQAGHPGVFTIPHFDGYAAVLIELDAADPGTVQELLTDAWLAMAPTALAEEHMGRSG